MALTPNTLLEAARALVDPGGNPVTVAHADVRDGHARVRLGLAAPADVETLGRWARVVHGTLAGAALGSGERLAGLNLEITDRAGAVVHTVSFGAPAADAPPAPAGHRPIQGLGRGAPHAQTPQSQTHALPGVRHAIAVGAGKGGVGKSTIAVNLAVGLARRGHAVGLLDGDIYGPSIPTLMGLHAMEQVVHAGKLQPFYVHGVKTVTIGKLVDAEKPLIWRGPMAHGAFKQLAEQTDWGDLDYLVIDLPPGTGDVPLTMAQVLRLTGAVVVCTPQRVAQDDAVRAAKMFGQLGIDVLGVVENMSYFVAEDVAPAREYDLFGRGGAQKMAARLGVPFLGAIPLTIGLRENSDRGDPSANFAARSPHLSGALGALVEAVESQAALAAVRQGHTRPTLTLS